MTSDPTFWLLARASGLLAYGLLTATVLTGLLLHSRPFGKRPKPAGITDLHRFLSLLGLGALAVHGLTLVVDGAVEIPLAALLLPGLSPYRPFWTALGVLAAELMVLLVFSFSLRKRIGTRWWRRLHHAAYLAFVLATAHGLMAGTDSGLDWALGIYLAAVGSVAGATAWRALAPPLGRTRPAGATATGRPRLSESRPVSRPS
ncbi:MAG: ferric reductase-like transmembrane domain-containing protein [Gaiellales bacterium]